MTALSSPRWRLAFVALTTAGCALIVPESRDPSVRAGAQERDTCPGLTVDPVLLAPASIERVEPLYVRLPSKSGHDTRLRGSALTVRPSAGLTAELLERTLRCHGARQTLGRETAMPDDPYGWPGAAIGIRVTSEGTGFRVELSSDDLPIARELVTRARAWASRRPAP